MNEMTIERTQGRDRERSAGPERGLRQVLEGMSLAFDPEAAGDLAATVQFEVTEPRPARYYLQIAQGECTFHLGRAAEPTLTITTPAGVWVKVARGN